MLKPEARTICATSVANGLSFGQVPGGSRIVEYPSHGNVDAIWLDAGYKIIFMAEMPLRRMNGRPSQTPTGRPPTPLSGGLHRHELGGGALDELVDGGIDQHRTVR